MINANKIKLQANGNWPTIIPNLAPQLSDAIEKTGKHVPCPVHGGKDGFRLYNDFHITGGAVCNTCGAFSDGLSLLQWVNNWSFWDTLKAVNEHLDGPSSYEARSHANNLHDYKARTPIVRTPCIKKKNSIFKTLAQSHNTNFSLNNYLNHRGLSALAGYIPSDIKAVESLAYWHEGKLLSEFPAMIGIVRNLAGEIVTLHRTYLTDQGFKAKVPAPKKLMAPPVSGDTTGCSIQLYKPTTQLAITEGIETALAVHLSTGIPVWAAISANLLEKVQIPLSVKEVFIMADKDISGTGEHAAINLANRLSTYHEVKIVLPEPPIPPGKKSIDWLDIYQHEQAVKCNSGEVV